MTRSLQIIIAAIEEGMVEGTSILRTLVLEDWRPALFTSSRSPNAGLGSIMTKNMVGVIV
jgi:hypothetical protein